MIAHEQGICGCHVHVDVPDRDAAIRVSNRLRPWLPLLLALTANSAVYRNTDTGYASWRSILWQRWPSAGPPPHFESADEYDAVVRMLLDSRRDAGRRDGLLGRPPVGELPDDRGARRRRPRHRGRDGAVGDADQGLRDDRAGGRAARREPGAAGAVCVAGRVLEVGARRPRRSRDRPDGEPRVGAGPRVCSTVSSTTFGPRSRRLATTTWCVPNSPASPSTATVRCGSGGHGSAGMTSPTSSPRRPPRRLE